MKRHVPEPLLFPQAADAHLWPHWRDSLRLAVLDVWRWRHHVYTTGWSYACQGVSFALWLYKAGQLSRERFVRYVRFFRHARRHERRVGPKHWAGIGWDIERGKAIGGAA